MNNWVDVFAETRLLVPIVPTFEKKKIFGCGSTRPLFVIYQDIGVSDFIFSTQINLRDFA